MPSFLDVRSATPAFHSEPLYKLLYKLFSSAPFLSQLLTFMLMFFGGYVFNSILSQHGLIPRTSVLGLLFWVLVSSSVPASMSFQPLWPAMILMLFSVNLAFSLYEQESNSFKLFNFGVLGSLSGMMNESAWPFIIWIYVVLLILRVNSIREWIIPILGSFVPILYLLIYWFLQNKLLTNLPRFLMAFPEGLSLPVVPTAMQITVLVFLFILFINALMFNYSTQADRNIAVRKRKAMLNAFAFVAVGALFMRNGHIEFNAFLIIPLGAHLAIWTGGLSRTARASVVVWIFVFLALANNIYYFFFNAHSPIQ
jgi:hypothetical protein